MASSVFSGVSYYTTTVFPVVGDRLVNEYAATSPIQSTVTVGSGSTALYKMRGLYLGATESWVGSAPTTPPPSGHAVTDITFVQVTQ